MDRLRPVRWVLAIALVATTIQASFAPVASAGASGTFLVVYKGTAVPSTAEARIQAAGGSLVYSYPQIGVAVATSDDALFGTTLRSSDSSVQGAVATAKFGTQLSDPGATSDTGEQAIDPGTPAAGDDSLSGLQWDMEQIQAPEARAITGGSPSVVVGDIDTGLDFTHPDLAANVDFADSVSCVGGVPNPSPAAWMDDNGHGTHTAGTIAAAKNGIGIVGVAPNVKIAGIKAGNAAGFFFPEAVVCAFMWAGTHDIRRDEQQLLRRPVALQLQERPGAAGHLERRAAGDPVRDEQRHDGRRGRGQRGRRPRPPDAGRDEPRRHDAGTARRSRTRAPWSRSRCPV